MGTQGITQQQALTQAVNRMGSQSAMARLCGVSQSAVWKWLAEEMALPAEHVLAVEAATGVSRHELRPDLYPRGLQDDVPYPLASTLVLGADLVAENAGAVLQPRSQDARGASEDPHEAVFQSPKRRPARRKAAA